MVYWVGYLTAINIYSKNMERMEMSSMMIEKYIINKAM